MTCPAIDLSPRNELPITNLVVSLGAVVVALVVGRGIVAAGAVFLTPIVVDLHASWAKNSSAKTIAVLLPYTPLDLC
ncbi:MAG: hypothetical protein BJ554DRAFT_6949 [Olpidium bornovanus]|uniref:Uncharacterized protein n=1 Tax=Olpidium bornovanus TaxID=278681 RepID=A0A8H8DJL2_9FUNG|nr:MAG: hypothetical protein BJ554DRAFT_6949 [Olpidium bornovanus]